MILVVQEIVIRWTKKSRSGEGAARRSGAPRRLELPEGEASGVGLQASGVGRQASGAILLHHVAECHEARDFAPETVGFDVGPIALRQSIEADCATVRYLGDRAEATWAWQFRCGAPKRSEHPRTVLTLGPGEWGRIEYNGRYSSLAGMAGWKYHRRVINVGLVEEVGAGVFEGEPGKEFRSMADLR